jgi:hypothetical protein
MELDEVFILIEDCERRKSKLTEWELKFMHSLSRQMEKTPLTNKQIQKLEKIWERITA